MSILNATQLVQAQGRGRDSELMHVTPSEVQALQGIAQLHGGSLTRNPQTGLPEAGFLENILPTIVGIGVGFATANPMLGAAAAGALGYGTSGSLEKGLIAGLGAFGGASALGSLAGVGAAGAAGTGAVGAAGAGTAGTAATTSIGAGSSIMAPTSTSLFPSLAPASGLGAAGAGTTGGVIGGAMPGASILAPTTTGSTAGIMSGAQAAMTPAQQLASLSVGDKFSALGSGFGKLFSDPSATFSAMGGLKGQGSNLLMAGAPLLGAFNQNTDLNTQPEQESYIRPQAYDPATQRYTALEPIKSSEFGTQSFADYRKSQGYQEGGEVQQRYTQPVRTVDPAVTEYNQMLMNQARQEYVQQQPMTNVPQLTPSLMAPPRPEIIVAPAEVNTSRKFAYDPNTQQFSNNPDYIDPEEEKKRLARESRSYGGGYYGEQDNVGSGGSDSIGADDGPVGGGASGGTSNADGSVGGGGSGTGTDGEAAWKRGGVVPKYAQGGIASAGQVPKFQAGGDMADDAFVVPADVVSALGNGSTAAGVRALNEYLGIAMPIEGEGDGLSDDIPASIEGAQPARVADGEVYVPPEIVAQLGNGDPERGAAKLYVMMDKIREAAHGKSNQQAEVSPEQVMPV